jgi:apolipoprotein D and lipocalin family protein
MKRTFLGFAVSVCVLSGCAGEFADLDVVDEVDINRYLGKWYEIASYPAFFQAGCAGTTAEYSLNDDGTIAVLNSCFEGSLDAELRTAEGSARTVEGSNNAKLKVRFFIFEGDYWILELGDDEDYGYALVGAPSREFLWILSREPQLDDEIVDGVLSRLPEMGFDPDRLEWTLQPEN